MDLSFIRAELRARPPQTQIRRAPLPPSLPLPRGSANGRGVDAARTGPKATFLPLNGGDV